MKDSQRQEKGKTALAPAPWLGIRRFSSRELVSAGAHPNPREAVPAHRGHNWVALAFRAIRVWIKSRWSALPEKAVMFYKSIRARARTELRIFRNNLVILNLKGAMLVLECCMGLLQIQMFLVKVHSERVQRPNDPDEPRGKGVMK